MTSQLKDELINLKDRLETIEGQLAGQLKEIEGREQKWKSMDEKADRIYNSQTGIVKINVGGILFATTRSTLDLNRNSLITRLVDSGRIDLNEEIYFDRSPKMFPFILDFMRTKEIEYTTISKEDLLILKDDAEYYNIEEIITYLEERLREIEFVSFEYSGPYIFKGKSAGTSKVQDLKEKNCLKGIFIILWYLISQQKTCSNSWLNYIPKILNTISQ